jgi:hypothetical protein
MAVLHTNESRQLYVVAALKSPGPVVDTDAIGTIAIKSSQTTPDGSGYAYIEQKGADTIVRSDLIHFNTLVEIKHNTAAKMQRPLKRYTVALDPTVNGGAPVAGQTYKLEIFFREWIGVSPEDQYYKFGSVYAYAGMTAAQFYTAMAASLTTNFKRESAQVLTFTASATAITITEVEQPWSLGLSDSNTNKLNFALNPDFILLNGDYFKWGVVTDTTLPVDTNFVPNGKAIADMEYFYHGERGDTYRFMGWPNVWFTKLLIDPTKTYDTFDIVYNFRGNNQESYNSRKVLTLVVPAGDTTVGPALVAAFPNATIVEPPVVPTP